MTGVVPAGSTRPATPSRAAASPAAAGGVANALERAGWQPGGETRSLVPADPPDTANPDPVTLQLLPPWHGWQRVESSAFALPDPSPDAFWRAELAPPFPGKLVPEKDRPGWCRLVADWPRRLPVGRAGETVGSGGSGGPSDWTPGATWAGAEPKPETGPAILDLWAEGLTAVVRHLASGVNGANDANGANNTNGANNATNANPANPVAGSSRVSLRPGLEPLDPASLVPCLSACGWTAFARTDHVQVNIERGGRLHRVRIGPGEGGGTCLEMELGSLEAASPETFLETCRAASIVAAAANLGMALIRVVHRGEEGRRVLLAQVHLGGLPPVAPWLQLALDAHRVAAGNLAREFTSLADPVVARWINRKTP